MPGDIVTPRHRNGVEVCARREVIEARFALPALDAPLMLAESTLTQTR